MNTLENIPFIRFNHLWDNKIVMTNIFWDSIVLGNAEFDDYISGNELNSTLKKELEEKMFYKSNDYEDIAKKYKTSNKTINNMFLHLVCLSEFQNAKLVLSKLFLIAIQI